MKEISFPTLGQKQLFQKFSKYTLDLSDFCLKVNHASFMSLQKYKPKKKLTVL